MRFYASSGDEARLTALLERGIVNVMATDERGYTALHLSAMKGHDACLKLLLEAGADITAKNKDGKTPLDLAKMNGHTACIALLETAGAR